MQNETIQITRDELAAAIKQWETESREKNWPRRDGDESRHIDNADYLIGLIKATRETRSA